jgi:carboxylesterase type B
MRNPNLATAERIQRIIETENLTFSPSPDNRTLISSPGLRRSMGAISPVPVMIGSNSQEGRVFVQGQNDIQGYVQNTFKNNKGLIKSVVDAYPVGKNGLDTPFDAIAQISTEWSFQCVSGSRDSCWAKLTRNRILRSSLIHQHRLEFRPGDTM